MLWLLYILRADIRPNMILYMFTADPGDRKAYTSQLQVFPVNHQIHYFSYNWWIPHWRPWIYCFRFPDLLFKVKWGIFHQSFPHAPSNLCFYWIRFISTQLALKDLHNDIRLDLLKNIVHLSINYFIIRKSAAKIVTYIVEVNWIQ